MSFASLGLAPTLLRALADRGHALPTPIQAAAIPPALAGRDVLGAAQTGSGKTLAYALPILQRLEDTPPETPRPTRALILVPTRELAAQVGETLIGLARHLARRVRIVTVSGGVSLNPQMMDLRGGAEVVVATPGRLLDLVARRALHLGGLGTLVLDEADRLLDAGFADELTRVLALLPRQRQTLLFSATFPPEVLSLAQDLLHEPAGMAGTALTAMATASTTTRATRLHTGTGTSAPPQAEAPPEAPPQAPPDITQRAIVVDSTRRTQLLRHLIEAGGWPRVLVFVATRYATEHVAAKLNALGLRAAALHGELSQGARTRALTDIKAGALRVLVATDMAARGIHIAQLPAVVNYDLPRSPATHVHRIGRTGRAGESGLAVSFLCADVPGQEAHFRLIEKRQGQRVPRERVAGFEPTLPAASTVSTPSTASNASNASQAEDTEAAAADERPAAPTAAPTTAPTAITTDTGGIKGRRKSKKDKLREAASAAAPRRVRDNPA